MTTWRASPTLRRAHPFQASGGGPGLAQTRRLDSESGTLRDGAGPGYGDMARQRHDPHRDPKNGNPGDGLAPTHPNRFYAMDQVFSTRHSQQFEPGNDQSADDGHRADTARSSDPPTKIPNRSRWAARRSKTGTGRAGPSMTDLRAHSLNGAARLSLALADQFYHGLEVFGLQADRG
jgi:hypothetical protein